MENKNSNRREFLKKVTASSAGIFLLKENILASEPENSNLKPETAFGIPEDNMFSLPALPYTYDALEPFIDKQTMELHHTKHHQAYVDKLNKALADAKLSGLSLEDICKNVSKYPVAIRNNGGGHYNHSLFWKWMKQNSGSVLSPSSPNIPSGKLGESIKSTFDSFENFKTKFSETATKVFGSGWTWLVINKDGKLEVGSTPNQDNPLMDISELKGNPILGLDVWEHAYYLKYQNKRADYISNWWNVVNWEEAQKRFEGK